MNEKMLSRFRQKGVETKVSRGHPFSLRKSSVFFMENGSSDLFAVNDISHFIVHYEEPLLFGFPESPIEIVATPRLDTSIWELPFDDIDASFSNGFAKWVLALSPCIAKEPPDIESDILTFRQESKTSWIEVIEGTLFLYGNQRLPLTAKEGLYPLSNDVWFQGEAKFNIVQLDANLKRALPSFSRAWSCGLSELIQTQIALEKKALHSRFVEEDKRLESAIHQMEEVFSPTPISFLPKASNPLQKALLWINSLQNLQFVFPRIEESLPVKRELDLICEHSHIRKREIELTENWWKQDHGPLLGFYQGKPVVFHWSLFLKAWMIDENRKVKITEKIAKEISANAYMFYVPLPAEMKTFREIYSFFSQTLWQAGHSPSPFWNARFFNRPYSPDCHSIAVWHGHS